MHLDLSDEQRLLQQSFAKLFSTESSPDRVRAAEPLGFDAELWKQLADLGVFALRLPVEAGGGSLLDAAIVMHEAGRKLASGPLLEAMLAARVLAAFGENAPNGILSRLLAGTVIVSIALHDLRDEPTPLVVGGAVAGALVARDGASVVLLERELRSPSNLGSSPLAYWDTADCRRQVLLGGEEALAIFAAAVEEWKLLSAAALAGLGREALEIAARYSRDRKQFGRAIGEFQGLAHPLAESAAEVEGARLLVWKAIWSLARQDQKAAAFISMSFLWASIAATRAVARALHAHGGYGLSLEYDIQLYYRRAKSLALPYGDPQGELAVIANRLWSTEGSPPSLPPAGDVSIDFGLGESAERLAETARAFFEENLDDELRAHAHFAWEGHHPGFQRKLAAAGLLFPAWPRAYGGQDRNPYEMHALREVMFECGWSTFAIGTTNLAALSLMEFGSEELKREVLPRIARGDAIVSLGYTEPGSGSDVAAAETRATRVGDDWLINGQKMFTSGANLAQYVFLLTRTDPDVKKHAGLTMFLVPLDSPGIEIQPIHTISDERTNVTYYSDVRVTDRYRVGEVNGGWAVMAYALKHEHGGGYPREQAALVAGALEWARQKRRAGRRAIDVPEVRKRIARAAMHAEVAAALGAYALFVGAENRADYAAGPIARVLSTDHFIADAADLMDLCAPDSLLQGRAGGGQRGAAAVEFRYRLSAATAIYGGTTEIMKSVIAQMSLGMPRSRS